MISLIVARSRNHVIGKNGTIPWRLPADLKYFKKVTMGHTVIMGRKTWDSIGKPLLGRRNIVVSRNVDLKLDGAEVVHSLDKAFEVAAGSEIFVIGGEEIFRESINRADYLYITEIDLDVEDGDAFFNTDLFNSPLSLWKEISGSEAIPGFQPLSQSDGSPHERGGISFSFVIYQRKEKRYFDQCVATEKSKDSRLNCCKCGYARDRPMVIWSIYVPPTKCEECDGLICGACNVGMTGKKEDVCLKMC